MDMPIYNIIIIINIIQTVNRRTRPYRFIDRTLSGGATERKTIQYNNAMFIETTYYYLTLTA